MQYTIFNFIYHYYISFYLYATYIYIYIGYYINIHLYIYIYVYRYNLASKYLHRRPRPICFFHRDLAERCPRLVAASSWFYLEGRTTIVWQQSNNNPEKDQYEGFNQHKWVFNMNQLDPSKRGISYIYIYHIQGYNMGVYITNDMCCVQPWWCPNLAQIGV